MSRPDTLESLFELARGYEPAGPQETKLAFRRLQRRMQEPDLKKLQQRLARFAAAGKAKLADRKDLLLLVLAAPGRTEGVTGITRILKLLFLGSRELGLDALVPKPYAFQPYKFGPFCSGLHDDIDVLCNAGLVERRELDPDGLPVIRRDRDLDEGFWFNGVNVQYVLTRAGRRFAAALAEAARRKDPMVTGNIADLRRRLGDLPLRALLRYVYSRYPQFATESEILEQVLGPA